MAQNADTTPHDSHGAFWRDPLPVLFVVLWSTGFIGSKLGAPYSEPFTFLGVRFALAAVLMIGIGLAFRIEWPNTPRRIFHAVVVGLLIHGTYLGGVFWAIDNGLPAGISALIVSLQPLVTGMAAGPLLGEKVSLRQWLGLILGFIGVAMVIGQKLDFGAGSELGDGAGFIACFIGMLAIAGGALYQKRFCAGENLRGHQAIQLTAAAALMGVLSFSLETQELSWTPEFIFALAWLVCIMSIGTFTLLYVLIRRGAASQVASLFYLVPPVTAVMAYFLFDETLGPLALAGMGITVAGVALATRQK